RARGLAPDIKPNVFEPTPCDAASAQIVCTVGMVDTPVTWTDGLPADPRLSNIFVFDADSARSHVTDDGPASFTPRGLDVLPKLVRTCDEIKKRLKSEADSVEHVATEIQRAWTFEPKTSVGKLLGRLNDGVGDADIAKAADFSPEDQKQMAEL